MVHLSARRRWRPVLDEVVVQRVGVIAAEPDRDAHAKLVPVAQVGQGHADGERDRLGIEHDGAGRTVSGHLQPDHLGIKASRSFEIFGLNANEVGSDQMGHGSFLRYANR
jgi:hypothetical protein